jgi:hypothetical protein
MRSEKSTKEKSTGKIQNIRGKKLNPATNWNIQKLCNFFFFANESFMHAKHQHTPCSTQSQHMTQKSWLRGKEQIKVDHKNIKSIEEKKHESFLKTTYTWTFYDGILMWKEQVYNNYAN